MRSKKTNQFILALWFIGLSFSNVFATDQQLEFEKSLSEFKKFHHQLISVLNAKESREDFPSGPIIEGKSTEVIRSWNFFDYFLEEANAYDENRCFFGGWPRSRWVNVRPLEQNRQREFWGKCLGHTYDRAHNCGAKDFFRCNPVVFGPGSNGKGHCIQFNRIQNVTKICYEQTADHVDELYKKIKSDPQFRSDYLKQAQEIIEFCNEMKTYSACEYLSANFQKIRYLMCVDGYDGDIKDLLGSAQAEDLYDNWTKVENEALNNLPGLPALLAVPAWEAPSLSPSLQLSRWHRNLMWRHRSKLNQKDLQE